MQSKAVLRNLKSSERKVRLVIDTIRGKSVNTAENILNFSAKSVAKDINKLLTSAVSNMKNKNASITKEQLYIKSIFADGGRVNKRYRPRAQGNATRIRKSTSHISIILEDISESNKEL